MINDKTARCQPRPGEVLTNHKCNNLCARPHITDGPKQAWQFAPIKGDNCPSFLEKQA
jgi:hypothetical protein